MNKNHKRGVGYWAARAKRERRRRWQVEKRRIKRGGLPRIGALGAGKITYVRVAAPPILDLFGTKYRPQAAGFLHQIRRHSRQQNVGIRLDLSRVTAMWSPTALRIRAEIDRALACRANPKPFLCIRPVDHKMDEVFAQIGIYEAIGLKCDISSKRDDVMHWRLATGVLSEGVKGGSLLEQYEGRLAEGLKRGLYGGIIEAMTNTVQHAYEGRDGEALRHNIGKRWWLLSQERNDILTVAICDLGIGISESLPRSGTFSVEAVTDMLKGLGIARTDANAIRAAIELGRTRTNIKGRGRGLHDIVEAVNLSEAGRVMIGSNRGMFTTTEGKSYARNFGDSVPGTIIWWTVGITDDEQDIGTNRD
ncbi:hypothetical protein [Sphingomonas mali]|uniref:hypothetical protein n=1 Tax=Sphingomonas mali TaxID=40682 RepID=UPI0008361F57|nr:hypothetical protein [Sphingomonas mali]